MKKYFALIFVFVAMITISKRALADTPSALSHIDFNSYALVDKRVATIDQRQTHRGTGNSMLIVPRERPYANWPCEDLRTQQSIHRRNATQASSSSERDAHLGAVASLGTIISQRCANAQAATNQSER